VRAPICLQRIRRDEQQDIVTRSSFSGFFKGKIRRYSSLDFIAQVTLRVPPGSPIESSRELVWQEHDR
jgi:hypothetical protein